MPYDEAVTVKVFDGSGFQEESTHSRTVCEYRDQHSYSSDVTISVNSVNVPDSHEIKAGDHIACVTSNKTGGFVYQYHVISNKEVDLSKF